MNAWSVGALGGYRITRLEWPASLYGYVGYLNAFGTGYYARLGLEMQPPQLLEMLPW